MSRPHPSSNRWLMDGFCWYAKRMIRKSFHAFAVDLTAFDYPAIPKKLPLVVYSNHPGWWDPIVGMLLCQQYFSDRVFHAPIDSDALRKYRVFEKLGYFGIRPNTGQGARAFLDQAASVLHSDNGSLWITPEGKFTDVRDHRQPLMPGLAHLATKHRRLHCVPLAIEYAFSEERLPLLLCKFGRTLADSSTEGWKKEEWHRQLTIQLRQTQSELAEAVVSRRWEAFDVLMQTAHRPSGWYDWMRWSMMRVKGEKPSLHHGQIFRSPD